jgi:hypothetical protein
LTPLPQTLEGLSDGKLELFFLIRIHDAVALRSIQGQRIAKPEDAERIKQAMPRLQDLFQTYLREMRPEELRGSAGTYRLREELITRANVAVMPARITNILFVQMLIQ